MSENKEKKDFIVTYNISFKVNTAASLPIEAEDIEAAQVKALAVPKGLLLEVMKNQLKDQKPADVGHEFIGMLETVSEDVSNVEISAEDIIESK